MASLVAEKKPLFPPNSSKIHPGVFFPLPNQECFQPDVVMPPSPVNNTTKLQNGKMLSSSRPTSPKIPLMPPKISRQHHRTNSWDSTETANDMNNSKLGIKNVKAVYSSVPNVSKPFVPPKNVSAVTVMKSTVCMSSKCESLLVRDHKQQMPWASRNLCSNGPLSFSIAPQKHVIVKSTLTAKGPSPPPKSPRPCELLDDHAVFEKKSPIRRHDSTEWHEVVIMCPSCETPKTSPSKPSPSIRAKKPPTPPPKSPSKKMSRQNSSSSVGKKSSRHNSSSNINDNNQQITPSQSPSKNPPVTPQPVSPSLTKFAVTTKPLTSPKFQSNNETRSSVRLIRIEPTLPSHTSSHQWAARLSLIEDSSADSFPCSISPETLRSMELLFSFTDTDILEKLSDSWPVKCTYVVKEVIITERAYVQALTDVIKGYLSPLYSYILKTGDSPNFITTVFGNIVKIHQIHTNLLESMQSASTHPEDFAQVFIDTDFITQYTLYCTGYSRGNKCLEQTLAMECNMKQFIAECQVKLSHTLPLTSYLIKPVQRILKFPLLLEDLCKKFEWTEHPGHKRLKQALVKMSSVATEINTAFNDPVKSSRNCPKAIAQKRLNQVKELQRSRSSHHSSESPSTTRTSPSHSSSFSSVYSRATLFPVPSKQSSVTRFNYLDDKKSLPIMSSSVQTVTERDDRASVALKESDTVSCSRDSMRKPRVKDLKSFYDQLTEKSKEDMLMERRRTGSTNMNATDSLKESFVEVPHPPISRTNSLGNMFRIGRSSANKNKDDVEHKSLLRRFGRTKKSKNVNK